MHGVLGDASSLPHSPPIPSCSTTTPPLTIGLPSGNTAYGLGAGKTTYDFNNHVEKSFGIFSPDIEFGIGTSSSLIQSRVRKAYTSVGALAHFQAGTSIDLPLNLSFEADLYEELPLNSSTVYSAARSGKKKATAATTAGNAEDNGFNTSLDFARQRPHHPLRLLRPQHPERRRYRRALSHLPAQISAQIRGYRPLAEKRGALSKPLPYSCLPRTRRSAHYFWLAGGTTPFIRRYSTSMATSLFSSRKQTRETEHPSSSYTFSPISLPSKSRFYEQVTGVKWFLFFFLHSVVVSLSLLLLVMVVPRCCSPPCFYSHFE